MGATSRMKRGPRESLAIAMTASEILRRRMHHQHLWGPPLGDIEAVLQRLGAMQAQELQLAKWSVAQRTSGIDAAAVDRALAKGTILRTHVLRPTWHFVLPADARWLLALTGPRIHALSAPYLRKEALDEAVLGRTNELLARAVEGGRHRTRKSSSRRWSAAA